MCLGGVLIEKTVTFIAMSMLMRLGYWPSPWPTRVETPGEKSKVYLAHCNAAWLRVSDAQTLRGAPLCCPPCRILLLHMDYGHILILL
eukprot:675144-Pleurochrysis_carterae.AAC.9